MYLFDILTAQRMRQRTSSWYDTEVNNSPIQALIDNFLCIIEFWYIFHRMYKATKQGAYAISVDSIHRVNFWLLKDLGYEISDLENPEIMEVDINKELVISW